MAVMVLAALVWFLVALPVAMLVGRAARLRDRVSIPTSSRAVFDEDLRIPV